MQGWLSFWKSPRGQRWLSFWKSPWVQYWLRIIGIVVGVAAIIAIKRIFLPASIGTWPLLIVVIFAALLALTGIFAVIWHKPFHWIGAIVLTTLVILAEASWTLGAELLAQPNVTPVPIAETATPPSGSIYIQIALKDIQQQTGGLKTSAAAQLVIVTDLHATPEPGRQVAASGSVRECVRVATFLDTAGKWTESWKLASDVLIEVKGESLQSVAYGLAHADQIWLATDPACNDSR